MKMRGFDGLVLTMNTVTTLMISHNTEGMSDEDAWVGTDHELCHHTDDVTQH
jgi:hypothetical protein